jgi:alanyl-tRNA synthetase
MSRSVDMQSALVTCSSSELGIIIWQWLRAIHQLCRREALNTATSASEGNPDSPNTPDDLRRQLRESRELLRTAKASTREHGATLRANMVAMNNLRTASKNVQESHNAETANLMAQIRESRQNDLQVLARTDQQFDTIQDLRNQIIALRTRVLPEPT